MSFSLFLSPPAAGPESLAQSALPSGITVDDVFGFSLAAQVRLRIVRAQDEAETLQLSK